MAFNSSAVAGQNVFFGGGNLAKRNLGGLVKNFNPEITANASNF